MKRMTFIAAALAASSLMGIGSAANAARAIVITEAPPAPQVEVVPAPRANRVWVEGHYAWRNGDYKWVRGHWMGARRGMHWEQARWVQRPNGEWHFVEGHWMRGRDRDHDGVANRFDHDRDGDGVPNREDRAPDNPHRR